MSFEDKILNSNLMIVPEIRPFSGNDYKGTRSEIRFLRKQLRTNSLGLDRSQKSIFCSREDAKSRRVENRDELMETLAVYGFELYSPGLEPLENQIEIFEDADLIIGPHGANLTGIIFADNLTLIEVIGKKPHNKLYEYLCEILGHTHLYLRSKQYGDDFQVSISEVENLLSNFPELTQ
jgi:capsular polysaccharide biosynthesis protein